MANKLILASSSPRRQELLLQVKIPFTVQTANIDESQITTTDPIEKVKQLAIWKGENIPVHHPNTVVLSADTIVSYEHTIFEKPRNQTEAKQMISTLSDQVHDVYTGVMIRSLQKKTVFVERTSVEFWPLSEEEIDAYVATEDPYDKAGAYGIQSLGAMFVKQIIGDYYTVVGLPLSRVVRELRDFGIVIE
ncbi:Maf family protein [Oceanobacillus alkalisoli]|uniref:Maf family protein n=1 Tax=Oceanobacillus alkalisoli TaxID=2925113 RepID=UPI001EE4B189|nr:Maf family protein [Oceanobacillus alkalisoli]MCG5105094.1 Maf family protein [Oceanobacillus alkalisoli]